MTINASESVEIRNLKILSFMEEFHPFRGQPEISGWLFKWTNYLRGYQKRWFVLSDGLLSYYRNQEEMSHTCRGTISLDGANIFSDETNNIVVSNKETYHLRATNEAERQKWVAALELAKDLARDEDHHLDTTIEPSSLDSLESLRKKLEELQRCNVSIRKHSHLLQNILSEVEAVGLKGTPPARIRDMNEQSTLFQATASSMIKGCTDFLNLVQCQREKWEKMFQTEKRRRLCLERMVETLSLRKNHDVLQECSSDDENAVYYDCEDLDQISESNFLSKSRPVLQVYSAVQSSSVGNMTRQTSDKQVRRTKVKERPPISASLWNVLKNCIGKDLTKLPVPVSFGEPLSLLQRLTEDFEYAHVLDKAQKIQDPGEQLVYVAGFAVSSYSTTVNRTGKPFNPLLGETFECDRTREWGWKSIAEQVSHHPPISALHCESKTWVCSQQQSLSRTKFRGTYLQVFPSGDTCLRFQNGNQYVWSKVTTNIHNIVVGKLWIDHEGDMVINCTTTGLKCTLTFFPHSLFSREGRAVKGAVVNNGGQAEWEIAGTWDTKLEATKILKTTKDSAKNIIVWERTVPPADNEKYYNFTIFACQLNEMEDGVAPTDSRLRPDQRLMEEGMWDEADKTKIILEEKQRAARKLRVGSEIKKFKSCDIVDPYTSVWFKKETHPVTKAEQFVYQGQYWDCKKKGDWSRCPSIF